MAPRKSFPILALPDVALQKVVHQMGVNVLLKLHLNSTKTGVRQLISKCTGKHWRINVTSTPLFQSVEIIGIDKFIWECYWPRHNRAADYEDLEVVDVNVDGYTVKVRLVENKMVTISQHHENELIHWTTMLKNLFQCKIGTITLNPRHTVNFDQLITSPVLFHSKHLILERFTMSAHEAEYILEHHKTEHLEFNALLRKDFRCTKPIVAPRVQVGHGKFLTCDNLVQMSNDCEHVKIEYGLFTSEQLNEWLQKWMRSESRKLKTLELCFGKENGVDSEIVMDGIEKVAVENSSESAWTIQRPDALQAIVRFSSDEIFDNFEFNLVSP